MRIYTPVIGVSGCASITGNTIQSVSVQTVDKTGQELSGAACELTNNKGKWFVKSPGSVSIGRSNDDLQVLCNKDNHDPGRASVVSATKAAMFGNIILGGGIGAIVDHTSGAAYEYPAFFQVKMGETIKIESPNESDPQSNSPAMPTQPQPVRSQLQPSASEAPQSSRQDKLRELKRLRDEGLISEDVYIEQQRKVMEAQR